MLPSADSLTVSLNENVIKHAIDRRITRAGGATGNGNGAAHAAEPALPWLGSNFCLQVDHRMLDMLLQSRFEMLGGSESLSEAAMQLRSWGNIPILNEWKRLFPAEDPVKVHERLWHTTLVCPAAASSLERRVENHGIDRLRPPRPTEDRPQRPCGTRSIPKRQFRIDVRGARFASAVELHRDAKANDAAK